MKYYASLGCILHLNAIYWYSFDHAISFWIVSTLFLYICFSHTSCHPFNIQVSNHSLASNLIHVFDLILGYSFNGHHLISYNSHIICSHPQSTFPPQRNHFHRTLPPHPHPDKIPSSCSFLLPPFGWSFFPSISPNLLKLFLPPPLIWLFHLPPFP